MNTKQRFYEQLVTKHGMYLIAFIDDFMMEWFLEEYKDKDWTVDDVDSFCCDVPF